MRCITTGRTASVHFHHWEGTDIQTDTRCLLHQYGNTSAICGTRYAPNKELGGPQKSRSAHFGEQKHLVPLLDMEATIPRSTTPYHSHYTD
jgi:hypothetical protein